MDQDSAVSITSQAMELAFKVAAPLLVAGLVVGVLVSVFQAVTQIQEQSLQFIPKLAVSALVLMIAGPWMLGQVVTWSHDLWGSIPALVGRR
ncbi:flagellar biosynthesis protein FliQ [Patulibacter brassicae]|jgi:flagellar biosynthetic protein FliQ|uniref:Flagellar biosynthetic protein FliQ n=1 Tax=Patulibacter brassicae TaxID=1705717 RepID=A0ABU4VP71_9ACTN|nr:flagellar biosynthesis protein FliQ [Patulibacter brassicae]MDX8152839.1 flagellar biosynthesis protein FliQ [Patulibacter brassicae]